MITFWKIFDFSQSKTSTGQSIPSNSIPGYLLKEWKYVHKMSAWMPITALFITGKLEIKQMPVHRQMDRQGMTQICPHHRILLSSTKKWTNTQDSTAGPEHITLSKLSQTWKDSILYTFIYMTSRKTNGMCRDRQQDSWCMGLGLEVIDCVKDRRKSVILNLCYL